MDIAFEKLHVQYHDSEPVEQALLELCLDVGHWYVGVVVGVVIKAMKHLIYQVLRVV